MTKWNIIWLLLTLFVGACEVQDYAKEQDALDDNSQKWQDAAISHYQMVFRENCFCQTDTVHVEVMNGEVVTAYFETRTDTPQEHNLPLTVEQFFTTIQYAIDKRFYKIDVQYNSDYGYPETIYFDPYRNAVDEEYGFTISEFTILN